MGIVELSSHARNYGAKILASGLLAGESLQFVSDWLEKSNFSKFIKPVFEKTAREER